MVGSSYLRFLYTDHVKGRWSEPPTSHDSSTDMSSITQVVSREHNSKSVIPFPVAVTVVHLPCTGFTLLRCHSWRIFSLNQHPRVLVMVSPVTDSMRALKSPTIMSLSIHTSSCSRIYSNISA